MHAAVFIYSYRRQKHLPLGYKHTILVVDIVFFQVGKILKEKLGIDHNTVAKDTLSAGLVDETLRNQSKSRSIR